MTTSNIDKIMDIKATSNGNTCFNIITADTIVDDTIIGGKAHTIFGSDDDDVARKHELYTNLLADCKERGVSAKYQA